jgi:ABC-type dipeptide/oligopeptide/nickel transport system permease subunit
VGRLLAELARWLERLVSVPVLLAPPSPTRWRKAARAVWVVLALVLLVAPLALAIAGMSVNPDAAMKVDVQARNQPPSASHPWGTDTIGRDIQARVLRGGLTTLELALITAVILLLPGLLGGGLTGFLASRRVWWAESLADLLLLPADVLLFIPAVSGAIVMSMLIGPAHSANLPWVWLSVGVAIVLLPRAVRVYQTLWTAAPRQRKGLVLGLVSPVAFFLSSLFVAFGLATALGFLGFGIRPPTPTLGSVMGEALQTLIVRPEGVIVPGIIIWVCAFAFYTAADGLTGFFSSKEALARLNE